VSARRPRSSPAALPVSVSASELEPRGGAAARGCQARRHEVEDNIMSGCQAPPVNAPCGAPAGYSLPNDAPPTFSVIAPIPDLWPRFPPSTRSGWPDGLSLPRSSRRNAPRGPNSSRSRNLRFTPIPRGVVLSFSPRGRRGGFAAHGAVAPGLCCGPRYAAIWHANAHQLTTPRGPRDEALRSSGAPTQGSGRGRQFLFPKSRGTGGYVMVASRPS
jgi:hypothetical protein